MTGIAVIHCYGRGKSTCHFTFEFFLLGGFHCLLCAISSTPFCIGSGAQLGSVEHRVNKCTNRTGRPIRRVEDIRVGGPTKSLPYCPSCPKTYLSDDQRDHFLLLSSRLFSEIWFSFRSQGRHVLRGVEVSQNVPVHDLRHSIGISRSHDVGKPALTRQIVEIDKQAEWCNK